MMTMTTRGMALAAATLLAAPAVAAAQDIAINPYVGYYDFDESSFEDAFENLTTDADPIWGARLVLGQPRGLGADLAYGRTSVTSEGIFEDHIALRDEATIQLYYGALNWGLPLGPVTVFVSGGAGVISYDSDTRDAQNDLLVNFGAGATVPVGPARLRFDVKDHVDLCDAGDTGEFPDGFPDGPCFDDETLHNIEFSAGIVIGR